MEVRGVPLILPEFVTELRSHQQQAMEEAVDLFGDRNVVFLDAPTGAGKTIIGEGVRQVMRHRSMDKALYLCTTKSLQEQFLHDFKTAKLIKGRANYPTLDNPRAFDFVGERRLDASHCTKKDFLATDIPVCDECFASDPDFAMFNLNNEHEALEEWVKHCHHCHPWQACPYEVAKAESLGSQLAVANTAYLLTEANYVGRFGYSEKYGPRFPFFVIDEADTLESVLMNFVEVSLSPRFVKKYRLGKPNYVTKPSSWLEWVREAKETLKPVMKSKGRDLADYKTDVPPQGLKREVEGLERQLQTLNYVERSLTLEPENWVLDGHRKGGITLKPVTISSHTKDLLWKHGKKFLLMSATVVSPHQMAADLGLTENEWGSVVVDSNFPPERRPIHVMSRANMTNKTKDTEWPKMIRSVAEIIDRHPGERILIHTVSYAWTKALEEGLKKGGHGGRVLSYMSSFEREQILETYKTRLDAVLLAPSFDRGIDLPDDLCRVIIITKVPYPNLGDEQVKKRFFGTGAAGKGWYYTQTVRSIVQMTGRGMRHRNDHCITYLLDSQFRSNIWSNPLGRNRIPKWWTEALVWEAPRRS